MFLEDINREYFSAMHELKVLVEGYEEFTEYEIIYEANKPDVSKQMQKNANIKTESGGIIKRAIQAIQKIISNVISSIQNFFDELTMGKDERAAFEQFQQEIRNHPEFAKKKITVKDFRTISKKYDDMIAEVQGEIKTCMATNKPPSQELYEKGMNFLKSGVTATGAILLTEVAVKAARSNLGMAQLIKKQLNDENIIMKKLNETLGEKEAKKFKKEISKDAKLIGFHRLLVNLFAKKYDSLKDCITDTFSQVHELSQGKIFGNLGIIKKIYQNKTLGPAVKTAGKVAVKFKAAQGVDKVKEKAEKVKQTVANKVVNRKYDPTEKSAMKYMLS